MRLLFLCLSTACLLCTQSAAASESGYIELECEGEIIDSELGVIELELELELETWNDDIEASLNVWGQNHTSEIYDLFYEEDTLVYEYKYSSSGDANGRVVSFEGTFFGLSEDQETKEFKLVVNTSAFGNVTATVYLAERIPTKFPCNLE